MTTTETKVLDSITPRIVELVQEGLDIMEATKKALVEQIDFAGEMVEQRTDRSKDALDVMFNRHISNI